jgi:hypothetical protein
MSRTTKIIGSMIYHSTMAVARLDGVAPSTVRRRVEAGKFPRPDFVDENGESWWSRGLLDRNNQERIAGGEARAQALAEA